MALVIAVVIFIFILFFAHKHVILPVIDLYHIW